jgi:hypothetical protein
MKAFQLMLVLFTVIPHVIACTANAPQEGICVRSCANRPIGGGNVRAIALSEAVTFKNCTKGNELDKVTYRFFVYEDMSGVGSSSGSGGSSGSSGASNDAKFPSRIGKAGVAITPMVNGYNRLDTPSKDWCTDSCGYAEVAFYPTCAEQDISIGIIVPGMIYDGEGPPATKFTVTLE